MCCNYTEEQLVYDESLGCEITQCLSTNSPTVSPASPTEPPTLFPTDMPSVFPTTSPTELQTLSPTELQTLSPTLPPVSTESDAEESADDDTGLIIGVATGGAALLGGAAGGAWWWSAYGHARYWKTPGYGGLGQTFL